MSYKDKAKEFSSDSIEIRKCRIDEEEACLDLENIVWPTFNQYAEGGAWVDYDPNLHFVAYDHDEGIIVGTIDAVELDWNGKLEDLPSRGWTEIIELAIERISLGSLSPKAEWTSALGTSIRPGYEGKGLAQRLLEALKIETNALGYKGLVAPVRPTARWRMADISIEEYTRTRLDNDEHFDPWIRVHERIGGVVVGSCAGSAVFVATKDEWQAWSKIKLPIAGRVIIPNAINPLEIKEDQGILSEDSIWVIHYNS